MAYDAFAGDKSNSVRIDGATYLVSSLQSLPTKIGQKYLVKALKLGMEPVRAALLANTPVGPTGNLRAAVDAVGRTYKSGVAFGVVGYKRAVSNNTTGNNGYHSHLIEFGTQDRVPTSKPFLSSYATWEATGWKPPGWQGRWPFRAYRVRGVRAMHPLGKAFAATQSQALSIIMAEMQSGLDKGIEETRRKGL